MKNLISTVLFLSAISLCSFSYAEWSYSYNSFSKTYSVSDGKSSIQFKKEKNARKAAKALNKNDKKVAKQNDGFWNDGSEHCANPLNEC